jgi:hypothetical protein
VLNPTVLVSISFWDGGKSNRVADVASSVRPHRPSPAHGITTAFTMSRRVMLLSMALLPFGEKRNGDRRLRIGAGWGWLLHFQVRDETAQRLLPNLAKLLTKPQPRGSNTAGCE